MLALVHTSSYAPQGNEHMLSLNSLPKYHHASNNTETIYFCSRGPTETSTYMARPLNICNTESLEGKKRFKPSNSASAIGKEDSSRTRIGTPMQRRAQESGGVLPGGGKIMQHEIDRRARAEKLTKELSERRPDADAATTRRRPGHAFNYYNTSPVLAFATQGGLSLPSEQTTDYKLFKTS